ncbi:hypothetical protein UYO_1484 [Lachnospiraceae bacterium JC7]|nr:hypothetical protein UYO_1484 [Lachnospiraceae bacterium JC7]
MQRDELINIFRLLISIVSGEGRGEALFGSEISMVEAAFDRALSGWTFPMVYLEFPLMGKPCCDLGAGYGEELFRYGTLPDAQAFGYRKALDYFATISGKKAAFGYSMDLSRGDTERAGLYLQHCGNYDLIGPFLSACGEEARIPHYMTVSERLGKSWQSDYIAFFPGRPGTPTRLGGYAFGSDDLRELFNLAGFTAWETDMIELCRELSTLCKPADYQFDILSDGTLSDDFGIAFSFGSQTRPKIVAGSLRSGPGAKLMKKLQEIRLIDDRWKMLPDAVFARALPFKADDGSEKLIALAVLLNMVKIKFKAGIPRSVKFYIALEASEL